MSRHRFACRELQMMVKACTLGLWLFLPPAVVGIAVCECLSRVGFITYLCIMTFSSHPDNIQAHRRAYVPDKACFNGIFAAVCHTNLNCTRFCIHEFTTCAIRSWWYTHDGVVAFDLLSEDFSMCTKLIRQTTARFRLSRSSCSILPPFHFAHMFLPVCTHACSAAYPLPWWRKSCCT